MTSDMTSPSTASTWADARTWQDTAQSWDERYTETAQRWSGSVNPTLPSLVAPLPPGRALDVGCGEGADAVWLAEHGWDVSALDISAVAVERGRARCSNAAITWLVGDLAALPDLGNFNHGRVEVGRFDLVSLQYPAIPRGPQDSTVDVLLDLVAPGGWLLVVGHHLPAVEARGGLPAGLDPAAYVLPSVVAARLDEQWEVVVDEVRERAVAPDHPGASVPDVVLMARRRE